MLRLVILFLISLVLQRGYTSLDIYYIDEFCGTTVDLAEVQSASAETSRALTYPNNLNCIVSFKAPPRKKFYMVVNRFVTEKSSGQCFDYLSVYDGADTSSTPLFSQLCGELTGKPSYTTTADYVTFEFVSDESAKDRGFGIYLVAYTSGPSCSSAEILCENENICIDDETSTCDEYSHCSDGSDEAFCAVSGSNAAGLSPSTIGVIVGVSIAGIILAIIILFLIRWGYRKYQWNLYLKQLAINKAAVKTSHGQALHASKKNDVSYPLTHQYQNEEYININRAQRGAAVISEADIGLPDTRPPTTDLYKTDYSESMVEGEYIVVGQSEKEEYIVVGQSESNTEQSKNLQFEAEPSPTMDTEGRGEHKSTVDEDNSEVMDHLDSNIPFDSPPNHNSEKVTEL